MTYCRYVPTKPPDIDTRLRNSDSLLVWTAILIFLLGLMAGMLLAVALQ